MQSDSSCSSPHQWKATNARHVIGIGKARVWVIVRCGMCNQSGLQSFRSRVVYTWKRGDYDFPINPPKDDGVR